MAQCSHLNQIRITSSDTHVCEECVKMGDRWVHLRLCLECGHVGCCDNSPGRHATGHFHQTHHPVIRSFEPREERAFCYCDERFAQHFPGMRGESAPEHYAAPRRLTGT